MSTLKNGEFGIDLDKEKILWTDRKRHTIFSLPLSFTKYTLTETKLIIQRGCFKKLRQEFPLIHVGDELPFYCMNLIFYCKYVIISI